MKIRSIARIAGVFAIIAAFALAAYAKQEEKKEEKGEKKAKAEQVDLSKIPAAAKAAIEKEAAGAKIEKVKTEKEDGKEVYEAKWKKDGKKIEFKVDAAGNPVKEDEEGDEENEGAGKEEKIELSAAPAPVQAALAKKIADGKLTSLTTETEDGAKMFEADYTTAAGAKNSVVMDGLGNITEEEVEVKELPSAVKDALAKAFPDAKIGEAVAATTTIYEVKVTVDGKEKEIKVSPAGQIEKPEKECKGKDGKEECEKHKEGKKEMKKEGKHKEGKHDKDGKKNEKEGKDEDDD